MTTQNEIVGQSVTFGSTAAACTASYVWSLGESSIMLVIAIVSAVVGVCGLIFTVWNSNRQYKLTLQQYRDERDDRRKAMVLPPSLPRRAPHEDA